MLDRRRFLEMAALAAAAAPAVGAAESALPDAARMAQLLRRGAVTPLALVDQALAALQAVNGRLNAARHLYPEQARAAAAAPRGRRPLAGIPTFTKDLAQERGRAFTEGCRAFADRVGAADEPLAAAMDSQGLVSLGRSTTPEFGLLPTTEPLLGGPTRNPWNPAFSCGGSSGGAGALVAAGVVPFAHASDGGGSIRIPASANGLVGLKPSRGRMRGDPAGRDVTALVVNGCVSRSVRDTAAWLAALEAPPGGAYPPVGLVTEPARRALRIGLRPTGHAGEPHPDVRAVFDGAVDLLKRLGHRPVDARMPYDPLFATSGFLDIWSLGAAADAARVARAIGREPGPDDIEPATLGFVARARRLGPDSAGLAIARLEQAVAGYLAQFDAFDVLMTPVLADPVPRLGAMAPTVPFDELLPRVMRLVSYTPIENAAGAPALALPLGMSSDGTPIGLQFTAPPGGERRLLELGYAIERARPWAHLKPAIWAR